MSMIIKKQYEMAEHPPLAMGVAEYEREVSEKYSELLKTDSHLEESFQSFFERNPCMLPYAGNANHGIVHGCVFSQPTIEGGGKHRRPDFMWIASTSLELIPVFIEIERASKNAYRMCDLVQNASFSQAENQILEWQALLESEGGRHDFCERYQIPSCLRERKFSPRFILVYGRRNEYENDPICTRKRAMKNSSGYELISFDRLRPSRDLMCYPCAKLSEKRIKIISIPPTFQLGPIIADDLCSWSGFNDAVDRNEGISSDRKSFLKKRFMYWRNFGRQSTNKGIVTSDWE